MGTYIHDDSHRCLNRDTGEDEVSLVTVVTISIRIFCQCFAPPEISWNA